MRRQTVSAHVLCSFPSACFYQLESPSTSCCVHRDKLLSCCRAMQGCQGLWQCSMNGCCRRGRWAGIPQGSVWLCPWDYSLRGELPWFWRARWYTLTVRSFLLFCRDGMMCRACRISACSWRRYGRADVRPVPAQSMRSVSWLPALRLMLWKVIEVFFSLTCIVFWLYCKNTNFI